MPEKINVTLYSYLKKKTDEMIDSYFSKKRDGKFVPAKDQIETDLNTLLLSLLHETAIETRAQEVAVTMVRENTPLHHVIDNITKLRTIVISCMWDFAKDNAAQDYLNEISKYYAVLASAFDKYITVVTYEYQNYFNKTQSAQKEVILELSTPIIPLSDTVGVLPLVGDIDTARAQIIREFCLQRSSALGIEKLVIDLSGVPIMDTMVANELFQIEKGLKLLGVKAILTGIRPEIAQTAIRLGLDFSELKTYANLKQSLREIL